MPRSQKQENLAKFHVFHIQSEFEDTIPTQWSLSLVDVIGGIPSIIHRVNPVDFPMTNPKTPVTSHIRWSLFHDDTLSMVWSRISSNWSNPVSKVKRWEASMLLNDVICVERVAIEVEWFDRILDVRSEMVRYITRASWRRWTMFVVRLRAEVF